MNKPLECNTWVERDTLLNMGYSKIVMKWMNKPLECNTWVERDTLLNMGYSKIVMKKDEQEAAAAGLLSKPLTAPGVTKALKDFGVDGEAAGHSPIGSLSHGQRVKIA